MCEKADLSDATFLQKNPPRHRATHKLTYLYMYMHCLNTKMTKITCFTLNSSSAVQFFHFCDPWRQLIQCKADPNTVNEHGNTPLHYACFWGQDEVAEVQQIPQTPTLPLAQCNGCKGPSSGENWSLQCFVKRWHY